MAARVGARAVAFSGTRVQAAIAMNDRPRIQRSHRGSTAVVIQAPSAPAMPWLMTVAHRMPAMMGSGFLNRAARMKASNWVLSPISASATTPVETIRACMGCSGCAALWSLRLRGPAPRGRQTEAR